MVIQFLILVGLFLVCISNTRTAYLFPPCSICYQSVIAKCGSRRLNVRRDDSRISTMTMMGVGIVRFNHEKSKKHLCRKLSIQRCFFLLLKQQGCPAVSIKTGIENLLMVAVTRNSSLISRN